MVTLCWAAKGGSGTTVVATAMALSSSKPSLLVDLDGEIPAVLGLAESDRPGVADWLASSAEPDQLADLLIDIGPRAWLLPWQARPWTTPQRNDLGGGGAGGDGRGDRHGDGRGDRSSDAGGGTGGDAVAARSRWSVLGDWLHDWSDQWGCDVTVDIGTRPPVEQLRARADRSLLVTRACYLSLRRAVASSARPTGIILVDEPGRGLTRSDIEQVLGVPVEAVVSLDPSVSRAVDAGLLASRLPRMMTRALRQLAA